MSFESLNNEIMGIKEQFKDIMYHMAGDYGDFNLVLEIVQNPFGGNPVPTVTFDYKYFDIAGKKVVFEQQLASQSEKDFVNEIKSYLFDCIDTFVNMV